MTKAGVGGSTRLLQEAAPHTTARFWAIGCGWRRLSDPGTKGRPGPRAAGVQRDFI